MAARGRHPLRLRLRLATHITRFAGRLLRRDARSLVVLGRRRRLARRATRRRGSRTGVIAFAIAGRRLARCRPRRHRFRRRALMLLRGDCRRLLGGSAGLSIRRRIGLLLLWPRGMLRHGFGLGRSLGIGKRLRVRRGFWCGRRIGRGRDERQSRDRRDRSTRRRLRLHSRCRGGRRMARCGPRSKIGPRRLLLSRRLDERDDGGENADAANDRPRHGGDENRQDVAKGGAGASNAASAC